MSEQSRSGSTTRQAKQTTQQAADKAQDMAAPYVDKAEHVAMDRAQQGKNQAASTMSGVASAFRQVADQMRNQNQSSYAGYADQAAEQIDSLASYLQSQNVNDMIDRVERFGREQPMLFVGGAFAFGLVAARFLKASRPEQESSYGTGQGYRGRMGSSQYSSRSHRSDYPSTYSGRTVTERGSYGTTDVTTGASGTSTTNPTRTGTTSTPTRGTSGHDYSATRSESRRESDATR
jgi:ElaB/YqjD/DUF883 family membrane-anchored ribosome-binding protein